MKGYERRMIEILTAPDPEQALRAAAADPSLSPALRRAFAAADPDGVRLTALLVARLRFERLLRGCPEAAQAFDADAAAFAADFRRYHAQVPPTAFFPLGESMLYRSWLSDRASPTPPASPPPSPSPARRRSAREAPPSRGGRGTSADRPSRAR